MFGFGKKKNKQDMNISEVDLTNSTDFTMAVPRYIYTIKIFESDENGKVISTIQPGVKANSDKELIGMYAMCDQKIQILEKREVNPPTHNSNINTQNTQLPELVNEIPSNQVLQIPSAQITKEPIVKYFSAGGLEFKMVDQEVYQKQWIRATEEECNNIRIINDSNNKIVSLKDKHIEIQHWIKVESNDQV